MKKNIVSIIAIMAFAIAGAVTAVIAASERITPSVPAHTHIPGDHDHSSYSGKCRYCACPAFRHVPPYGGGVLVDIILPGIK